MNLPGTLRADQRLVPGLPDCAMKRLHGWAIAKRDQRILLTIMRLPETEGHVKNLGRWERGKKGDGWLHTHPHKVADDTEVSAQTR